MAGDTRDSNPLAPSHDLPPGETSSPAHVNTPNRAYEVFSGPPPNANSLPDGSGRNTAGGKLEIPKLSDGLKTIRLEDFKQVHQYPCVRESLINAIGAGFGMGGIRALWGAPVPKAANWAVGTFIFAAFASFEFCQYKRMLERAYMARAVEIIDRKKVEKEAEAKKKREERKRLKEQADRKAEEAAKKSNWKFW